MTPLETYLASVEEREKMTLDEKLKEIDAGQRCVENMGSAICVCSELLAALRRCMEQRNMARCAELAFETEATGESFREELAITKEEDDAELLAILEGK